MTSIHNLKASLEAAETNYRSADIEHPTAVHLAKEALTEARYEYWNACAELVTRLPAAISKQFDVEREGELAEIYEEVTGEPM